MGELEGTCVTKNRVARYGLLQNDPGGRKYYELTDSAEPMLRLARERFPSLAAVPGDRETVDQTR